MPEPDSAPAPQNGHFLPPPKQIRFVSTDGQPHAKRRRINAACLTCRRRKTRCSGDKPECKTCTDNGHVCAGYAEKAMGKTKTGGSSDEDSPTESPPKRRKSQTVEKERPPSVPPLSSNPTFSVPSLHNPRANSDTTELRSPESGNSGSTVTKTRVPFFRYFGPTAIVPGFKQMVVQIKDRDHRPSTHSASHESPASLHRQNSIGNEPTPQDIAFYDASDTSPVPDLIVQLCELFFETLGCNYPFLQKDRFMHDLQEKRVEAILVDAICAITARFSNNTVLSKVSDSSLPVDEEGNIRRAFRGLPYAQRAASGLIDAFGCPTIAVAQACLLLAYEEFGTDRDSGLWMFLGTSIRMAQDLGISKVEGLMLEGRLGATPKIVKMEQDLAQQAMRKREEQQKVAYQSLLDMGEEDTFDDRRASEHERIDTFWAILFLDRAVSIGVGRPVTLRDKDIEISFPHRPDETIINGHPHPYPVMIRIMHLNGRIADVINNIHISSEVNTEGLKRLTAFEKDLTGIYQRMSPKLHFNATNFQHYVKAGQGTNFILLHFWFHTNIILLHQPTLLQSLNSKTQQLFPDSRELSMSSAKTIADILAFAELIDNKSLFGNPFVTQPIYIAACAFLAEARAHASMPSSRHASPPEKEKRDIRAEIEAIRERTLHARATATKHSLLATAANQNYQRCYNALKVIGTYWAGVRYIMTALDGKSAGLNNPTLFTEEDIDGEMPSEQPSFIQPGWRKSAPGPSPRRESVTWSPRMDWSQAIGWSLTGTTNSPAPNFSFLYSGPSDEKLVTESKPKKPKDRPDVPLFNANLHTSHGHQDSNGGRNNHSLAYDSVSTADADLLLGLGSYSIPAGEATLTRPSQRSPSSFDYQIPQNNGTRSAHQTHSIYYSSPAETPPGFADMLIESQEVDMPNPFQNDSFNMNFPGGDNLWLEYLPSDVLSYFGQQNDLDGMVMPSASDPPT